MKKRKYDRVPSIAGGISFSKHVIKSDYFDRRNFERITKRNPSLREEFDSTIEDYPQFVELQEDVYNALYKYNPRLLNNQQIDSQYLLNSKLMESLLDSDDYKDIRRVTKTNTVNSLVGTQVLSKKLVELLEKYKEEFEDLLEQMKQAQQAMQDAQEDEDGDGQGQGQGQQGEEGDGEGQGSPEFTLEEAQKIMAELKSQFDDKFEKSEMSREVQYSVNGVSQKTKDVSSTIKNWGLEQDPTFSRAPYQEKIKMIDRLKKSSKLKQLSKLAGRYKAIATKKKKFKVKKTSTDLQDVELGDDLTKMVSNEAALLVNEKTKPFFFRKYREASLQQYRYEGRYALGRGPIVAAVDSSYSMSGEPEIFAKATALGLLEMARMQNRDFFVIHFDAGRAETLHTNEFLTSKPFNIDEVINMAEYFSGGSTDFEEPLKLARQKIDTHKKFSKADIIFITDGQSAVTQQFLNTFLPWKEEKHVQVYSVLINERGASDSSLKLFSDKIVPLNSWETQDGVAEGIFESLR